jgi:hypothetical protein
MRTRFRIAAETCLVFGLVLLASSSRAATTPIYKCLDKNLGVLYTDEPCKDGEQLNIRPGEADPAAVARLERERDALDRSAAQRIADLRVAAQAESAARMHYEPVDEPPPYDYAGGYVSDYGIGSYPFMHRHPAQTKKAKLRIRHFAPPPPYVVPRR